VTGVRGGGVLVARLDNLGDVLLAGPAVRAAAATGRPVHLLCGPRGRAAAEMLPGVSAISTFHAPWIETEPIPVAEDERRDLVARVRAAGITDAAVLGSSHQSPLPLALLLRWAGVERIAAVSHDHAGSLLDVRIPGDPDLHEVQRGLLVTEALGFPTPADDRMAVDLGDGSLPADVARELGPARPGVVVVHPGASVPARTMAPAQWGAVVTAVRRTGRRVVVTGSAEEARLGEAVLGEPAGVTDLRGRLSLRQLGTVLARADAVVCGNTGPMHLAAAVGTPVVAAFAPTVPLDRWRPWRVPHVVLGDQDVACAGCRSRTCPLDEQVCLAGVCGADVVEALDRLGRASHTGAVAG
jgi:ADP-heptose:LPS heptosyltransferase